VIRNLLRRVIGKKSTEEDRSSKAYLPFWLSCRGIVNLARRWPQGQVAQEAKEAKEAKEVRIPVGLLPVVRFAWTNTILQNWLS